MRRRLRGPVLATGAIVALSIFGCQEKLTSPGDCPALCPGGGKEIFDTIIDPIPGSDSSFAGYVARGAGQTMLVSNTPTLGDARAVIRFASRLDTIPVSLVYHHYTVDSVAFNIGIRYRDTTVKSLQLLVYRLPNPLGVDSTIDYATVQPSLIPGNLVGVIPVHDTLRTGRVQLLIKGPDLTRITIPGTDSGVVALAIFMVSAGPTGVRLGTVAAGDLAPQFVSYVKADSVSDTTQQHQTVLRVPTFNSWVQGNEVTTTDPDLLQVGGTPSSRAVLRFNVPSRIRDSSAILRATLELTPSQTFFGLHGDSVQITGTSVLADLGQKSPLCQTGVRCGSLAAYSHTAIALLPEFFGPADVIRIEVVDAVRAWQGELGAPQTLFVGIDVGGQLGLIGSGSVRNEGSVFTQGFFRSTRSVNGQPRLRISYTLPFQFEKP